MEELWDLFGDIKLPKLVYFGHWIARIVGLIAIPISIYVASFVAHFKVLHKSGPGDDQMNSLFQARLEGNKLAESPLGTNNFFLTFTYAHTCFYISIY